MPSTVAEVRGDAVAEGFPDRTERRSALMAPIPRPLADGDMSLFDLPLGDLRPWMADRRLSHGIAMACRPRSSSVCRPLVRRHAPGGPYERPDHLIFARCGMPRDPVDAPPGFSFGPVQAEGWMA